MTTILDAPLGAVSSHRDADKNLDPGSLKRLIVLLWQKRLPLLYFVIVGATIGLLVIFLSPNRYRASMTIAPVTDNNNSNISSGASAALNLLSGSGSSSSENFNRFQALLTSYQVAEQIAEHPDILKIVVPITVVDGHVEYHPSILSRAQAFALGYTAPEITPSMIEERLNKVIVFQSGASNSILPSANSSIVGISFENTDPNRAKKLLEAIFQYTDTILRNEQIAISRKKIGYYEQSLDASPMESERQYLYQAMAREQGELIRLQSGAPIAAQIVDAIHASDKPVYPRPLPILVAAIFGAFIVGAFYVLIGFWWRGAL